MCYVYKKIRYKSDFKIPHNGESWLNRASKLYITFMQNTLGQSAYYFFKKYVEKCTVISMSAVKSKPWNYSRKI